MLLFPISSICFNCFSYLITASITTLPATIMHFLPLVSMVALALAAPHEKRQSCVSQQWAVQGFSSFTADPSPTGVSHISFTFSDPNTSTSSLCSRSLAPGSGSSPADPNNFYPCQDTTKQYKFDGTKLTLKHTFDCAGTTVTGSGSANLALQCVHYPIPLNGTQCQTVAQVNIPVTSLIA